MDADADPARAVEDGSITEAEARQIKRWLGRYDRGTWWHLFFPANSARWYG